LKMTILNVVFLGPAGSGKTTLTATFGEWLEKEMDYKVSFVNLDPGCEYLPYSPDFDIRSIITTRDIMIREKMGPNSAMVRAMELMKKRIEDIVASIVKLPGDICLIDTPGQMEVFIFHAAGPKIVKELENIGRTVNVFLLDATLTSKVSSLVVAELMSIAVQLLMEIPTVTVLSKIDKVDREDIDRLILDIEYLKDSLRKEGGGVIKDLSLEISEVIEVLRGSLRIVKVSATKGIGFDQLYDLIHETFCTCGDLT